MNIFGRVYRALKKEFYPPVNQQCQWLVEYRALGDYWAIFEKRPGSNKWEECGTATSKKNALDKVRKLSDSVIITENVQYV